jgi:GNAT superfamily N-acetyltransferase
MSAIRLSKFAENRRILMNTEVVMRNTEPVDLPALTAIRPPEAIHRGRLRDAQRPDFHYFVFLDGQHIVGFSSLVFRRPASWSNADDDQHLPQIVDLHIDEASRGRGYGSAAIQAMERFTVDVGYPQLYIAVEPVNNPRAYTLYQRLGYRPLQAEPYHHRWQAVDGDNQIQRGEAWLVDMVKALR